jgi:hypothetical protein
MRHYVYKITFEGTRYYYWGIHTEKTQGEEYWGSPGRNKWVWDFYYPEKQILQICESREKAYKVESRLIEWSKNDPLCLNVYRTFDIPVEDKRRGSLRARAIDKINGERFFNPEWQREQGKKGSKAQPREVKVNNGLRRIGQLVGEKWADPDHPELGVTNVGNLVKKQKRAGLPFGPENRVKVKDWLLK